MNKIFIIDKDHTEINNYDLLLTNFDLSRTVQNLPHLVII